MIDRLKRLARLWFTFESPVDRRTYFRHGLGLMLVKYGVDATLIWSFARIVWTPLDYLKTGASFSHSRLATAPPFLLTVLAVWTLPFIWIGITMSVRRALDAGRSGWFALLFFVPPVNYAFMLVMSLLPTRHQTRVAEPPRPAEAKLPSALLSMACGLAVGLGMLTVNVSAFRSYGVSLFAGMPF